MLQLVLGRAGFGKTHYIEAQLVSWLSAHEASQESCVLLVPEQFSFETERTLVQRLGAAAAARIQVLSFTRMAELLVSKSSAARPLTNGARVLLMSRAMSEVSDRLSVFRGESGRGDTVTALLRLLSECRQSAVTATMLEQTASVLPKGMLRQKTTELSWLLAAYDALAANGYTDAQELVSQLAARLPESGWLRGKTVFVDGFKGFTAAERQVLETAMAHAASVTVTLCTDSIQADEEGLSRFSVVSETARRLIDTAHRLNCTVAKPIVLSEPYRFQNDALRVVEETAFAPSEETYDAPTQAVRLTACEDLYEECAYVTKEIRRLLRSEGLRARQIAVVARDLSLYDGVLDASLEQAGIPFYLDRRAPIVSEGAVTAVLTALRIVDGGWQTESLLRLMKTGLLGFSAQSAATLENYVFVWGITGARFRQEWRFHPQGFAAEFSAADQAKLRQLNRLRRRLIAPLEELQAALSAAFTGEQFAHAVYRYLQRAQIDRLIARQIRRLQESGEPSLAEHTQQVWDALMGLLDDMADVLGAEKLSLKEATELFRLAASATEIGSIPQHLDAVQIGSADRMRFSAPRAVFVLGANEGVFPALPTGDGVLTDRERRQLMEAGLPLTDDSTHHTAEEHFFAYAVLSAASERVLVSFWQTAANGEKAEPSAICHTLTAHFPQLSPAPARLDDGSDIETAEDALERMADGFRAQTPLSRALYELLWQQESLRDRMQTMTRIAEERPLAFEDTRAAERFFGKFMNLSATRVDAFYQCRFAYFCRYGLGVQPRRSADLGALEFGTLAHYVMETALPRYAQEGFDQIAKARCFADADAAVKRYVEAEMGGTEDKTGRFLYLLKRLVGVCGNFLWQAVRELHQSQFVPTDYELPVAPHEEQGIEPLLLTLPDGTRVQMIGKIDRVDVYKRGDISFVRIVDYKTGTKAFCLSDVVEGLNLQMLIYMLTVWQNGGKRYGKVMPAGLLYMSSKLPVVRTEETIAGEQLEEAQIRQMRMNGLLIDDPDVLGAMEPGLRGLFIPAKLKKDGSFTATSSVISYGQLGALKRRAETLLRDMAATLRAGDIDARPLKTTRSDPCAYCDYRAVCGHEEDDRSREPSFETDEAVLRALHEEEETT